MRRVLSITLACCISFVVLGCIRYRSHWAERVHSFTPGEESYFSYSVTSFDPKEGEIRDRGSFTVRRVEFPSIRSEKAVVVFYYLPKNLTEKVPAIVILPITRGDRFTRNFAAYLARQGFASLRFQSAEEIVQFIRSDRGLTEFLTGFEEIMRGYVIDVRRGIDWLVSQEEINGEKIGVMGISLGAIVGSVVASVDPRVKASVFLLGGGNLPGILLTTEEFPILRARNRLLDREELTPEEMASQLEKALKPIDPLTHAHRLDPSRVLMINAYFDRVIRRKYTRELWEASGRPELIFVPAGHYSSAFFLWYARSKTVQHFTHLLSHSPGGP